jgi:succinate-acetate transporter protein
MTVGSLKTNKVLFIIFVLIDFLFLGLTVSAFTGSHSFHMLAATSEFLIALVAFYGFAANIINHQFDKEVLKLGRSVV